MIILIAINRNCGKLFGLFQFRQTSDIMNRWVTILLIGVALQGVLSMSPIPVLEDEWEEFSRMLRDPAYRLPTTTLPRFYEVSITPYFETVPVNVQPFTFDGEVAVYLSPTVANVSNIVMHCEDITIQTLTVEYTINGTTVFITQPNQTFTCVAPYSFLTIQTTEALVLGREYVVRSTYRGNLQTDMRGFYRSWYDDSNGRRWMGTTQFQPGHARKAFPCYDEPGFKAIFDFTIIREASFSPTISNMPIRQNVTLNSGRIAETFYSTPVTSTYLLAFIVSHYNVVSESNSTTRPFQIYARNNVGNHGDWSLEIGELLLEYMEQYTQFPYYTMAANMNMKQAAIPDFSAGAMENWGLLTYREALILYDEQNTNHFYKQRIANIVSHEIAHMWFGNLVTCAWWDNLWLNEGFARFYQYYLTDRVAPELGFPTRFIVEQLQVAMLSDSVDTAHALTNPNVNDPVAVSAHFSTITYARGASILRMTQHLLSEDTYVKGLRLYLNARQYDVAEPHHLFDALDEAAATDSALTGYGVNVSEYFKSWSEKAGHPILTVTTDQNTGRMFVTQTRFEVTSGVSSQPGLWYIPITWTRGGAPDFENLKPSQMISAQATAIERGTTGLEWVIFNKQQSGFYRVNYDDTNWALLTRALRSNQRTVIHEYNRAQIIDDLFIFGRATIQPYHRVFNVISFLEFEDQYAPWIAAITGFNFARRRLAHDSDALQKLQNYILSLSPAITARLGFSEIANEPYMDGLLRMHVMEFLCNVGHQQCVAAGVQNFQNWRNGGFIPPNMRPWVYCVGLREGTAADFDYFWNRYLTEDLANEKIVMIGAAGCTSDQASLFTFMNAIVSGGFDIRPQDQASALSSAITSNEYNTLRAFEWLTNNVANVTATFGSISTPLNTITSRLLNEAQITQVQTWLNANQALIGTASYNTGVNGIATARANIQWLERRGAEFAQYFETGYVEENVDDATTTTTTTTTQATTASTTVAPGENETDSANIAALSFVMLIVTLTINIVM